MGKSRERCQVALSIDEKNKMSVQVFGGKTNEETGLVGIISLMEARQGYILSEMNCENIESLDMAVYTKAAKKNSLELIKKNRQFGEKVKQTQEGQTVSFKEFFSSASEMTIIRFTSELDVGYKDVLLTGSTERILELIDFSLLMICYNHLAENLSSIDDIESFLVQNLAIELETMTDSKERAESYELGIKRWYEYFAHMNS